MAAAPHESALNRAGWRSEWKQNATVWPRGRAGRGAAHRGPRTGRTPYATVAGAPCGDRRARPDDDLVSRSFASFGAHTSLEARNRDRIHLDRRAGIVVRLGHFADGDDDVVALDDLAEDRGCLLGPLLNQSRLRLLLTFRKNCEPPESCWPVLAIESVPGALVMVSFEIFSSLMLPPPNRFSVTPVAIFLNVPSGGPPVPALRELGPWHMGSQTGP